MVGAEEAVDERVVHPREQVRVVRGVPTVGGGADDALVHPLDLDGLRRLALCCRR